MASQRNSLFNNRHISIVQQTSRQVCFSISPRPTRAFKGPFLVFLTLREVSCCSPGSSRPVNAAGSSQTGAGKALKAIFLLLACSPASFHRAYFWNARRRWCSFTTGEYIRDTDEGSSWCLPRSLWNLLAREWLWKASFKQKICFTESVHVCTASLQENICIHLHS